MKHTLYAFLLATFLFACKSKTKDSNIDTLVTEPVDSNWLLIKKFNPIIHGVWVKADYIKKVIVTGSPLAAADKAVGITYLEIDTAKIQGDKLTAGAGFNNHEGGDLVIKYRKGEAPETIQTDSGELGYSVENGDTLLVITHTNQAHEKTVTRFIKALDHPDSKFGNGMDYLINKSLFAGNYAMTDTIGKVSQVTLSENGKVTGIPGLRTYYAMTDFVVGPDNTLDILLFNLYGKDQKEYAFKITDNTLKLYNTKPSADSVSSVVDKLIYTLVKKP